jgi:hypothetical protein
VDKHSDWAGGSEGPGWKDCADWRRYVSKFHVIAVAAGHSSCIFGTEYEDYYDDDFHIYNDVILYEPREGEDIDREDEEPLRGRSKRSRYKITIFGYPRDVFPPADFHTAVYYDSPDGKEYIYIFGNAGFGSEVLLVHRLDLQDYSIQKVESTGDVPPAKDDAKAVEEACVGVHKENVKIVSLIGYVRASTRVWTTPEGGGLRGWTTSLCITSRMVRSTSSSFLT